MKKNDTMKRITGKLAAIVALLIGMVGWGYLIASYIVAEPYVPTVSPAVTREHGYFMCGYILTYVSVIPFVVEGMTLGLTGAVAALGAEWLLYDAVVKKVQEMDTLKMLNFVPFREMLGMLAVVFAAAGLFVGIVGGWVSIRKFLKV